MTIYRLVKCSRLGWAAHVAGIGSKKLEGETFCSPRICLEDYNKNCFRDAECENGEEMIMVVQSSDSAVRVG